MISIVKHSIPVTVLILFFTTVQSGIYSQGTPPTLTAGLAAVTGTKGTIDVELLAEIISQKQDELKKEFLQRQILNRMDHSSFAVKNYTYSSLSALLTFKDKRAIERELLAQVSILSLQVGIAETILQLSYMKAGSVSDELTTSIKNYIRFISDEHVPDSTINRIYKTFVQETSQNKAMLLFEMDNLLFHAAGKHKKEVQKTEDVSFSAALLDCVYEVCRENKKLQELGFVQINPNLRPNYFRDNRFLNWQQEFSAPLLILVKDVITLLVDYHPLFQDFINESGMTIDGMANSLFENAKYNPREIKDCLNRLGYQMEDNSVLNDLESLELSGVLYKDTTLIKILADIDSRTSEIVGDSSALKLLDDLKSKCYKQEIELKNDISRAMDLVGVISEGLNELVEKRSLSEDELNRIDEDLQKIQSGLYDFNLRAIDNRIATVSMNDYVFIKNYVDPFANKMVSLGIFGSEEMEVIREIKSKIFRRLVVRAQQDISRRTSINEINQYGISNFSHLLRIITSLSNLDDVESYEHIFNTLVQLGVNHIRHSDLKYLREITYFVDAYTTINLKEEYIEVNVEDLLLKIISLYENRVSKNVQLYFGIGVNQTFDIVYKSEDDELVNSEGEVISNLGFASEKIGIKYKLINNKKLQSLEVDEVKGPIRKFLRGKNPHINTTPLISDFYIFGFGSGLLYNVANLTTEGDDFNDVLVGAGIGLAFYNSLDFSIWRSSPMTGDSSFGDNLSNRAFWGVSFDIKLTEYLAAVNKKRQMKKLQQY